jgi:predicted O-methyltransferase YrrM
MIVPVILLMTQSNIKLLYEAAIMLIVLGLFFSLTLIFMNFKICFAQIDELHKSIDLQSEETKEIFKIEVRESTKNIEDLLVLHSALKSDIHLKTLGGWALEVRSIILLQRLIKLLRPKRVLEFGSGASTIFLGLQLSKDAHANLVTIEHDSYYANLINSFLKMNDLNNVRTVLAPIDNGWYSRESLRDLPTFELVIVDGPLTNRSLGLDFMKEHSDAGTVFLIDDFGSMESEGLVSGLLGDTNLSLCVYEGAKNVAVVGNHETIDIIRGIL